MTSEVAVMNKEAIALAADSAVTFREGEGQKIFTSASKIFTLSKYQPVGVMIYDSAELMGIPWETLIKIYRHNLGKRTFKVLHNYAEDFFAFLSNKDEIFSEDYQKQYVRALMSGYFRLIEEEINDAVEKVINEEDKIDEPTVRKVTSEVIQAHSENWKKVDLPPSVPPDFSEIFGTKYSDTIVLAKQTIFQDLPLEESSSRQLTEIASDLFVKFPAWAEGPPRSGIVIAGFGTDDVFPVVESFFVEGRAAHYVKHMRDEGSSGEISLPNSATIIPFAQSEMVSGFMEGIDPTYQDEMDKAMGLICSKLPQVLVESIDSLEHETSEDMKKRLEELGEEFLEKVQLHQTSYRIDNYTKPVLHVVRGLPKDELAAMAESLINLTSFKRRVSCEDETVGGPIDVAVVSKGDGFIWIKRKHYFEIGLNPQFLANYNIEETADDDEES